MACNDPVNKTKHTSFNLKENTPYDPVTQVLDPATKGPIDQTGYTYESHFLDKEGGTILDSAVVSFVGAPTNATYKELLTEAENNALMGLATPPTFWEFFATKDAVRHKWLTADVGLEFAGEPAP